MRGIPLCPIRLLVETVNADRANAVGGNQYAGTKRELVAATCSQRSPRLPTCLPPSLHTADLICSCFVSSDVVYSCPPPPFLPYYSSFYYINPTFAPVFFFFFK